MTVKKTTKKKTTRKQKLSTEPVTISEFQSWLSGVVEFQPKDWTPNKQQWEAILNKINHLTDDNTNNIQQQNQPMQPNQQQMQHPQHSSQHRVSYMGDPNMNGHAPLSPPPVQHAPETVTYTEESAPSDAPVPDGKVLKSSAPPVQTRKMAPIQQSDGQVKSSFE